MLCTAVAEIIYYSKYYKGCVPTLSVCVCMCVWSWPTLGSWPNAPGRRRQMARTLREGGVLRAGALANHSRPPTTFRDKHTKRNKKTYRLRARDISQARQAYSRHCSNYSSHGHYAIESSQSRRWYEPHAGIAITLTPAHTLTKYFTHATLHTYTSYYTSWADSKNEIMSTHKNNQCQDIQYIKSSRQNELGGFPCAC